MTDYKGEKFKEYLKSNRYNMTDVAKRLKISRHTLYQYFETGELGRKVVTNIVTGLGVTEQDIWGSDAVSEPKSNFKDLPKQTKGGGRPKGIPMYNIAATAGVVGVFEDDHNETPLFYLDMPGMQDCEFGVRISGDSMYPRFRNGDWIGCKEVTKKEHILFGEVYYIITTDYKTVKYVQPHPENKDWVLLVPHNDAIKPTPLPKDEIRRLFMVKVNLQIL